MRMVNRTAVVIKPRQPFLDWINNTPQLNLSSPVTMEELLEDCDIILLPDTDSLEGAHELLEPLKPDLFAVQLDGWLCDPNAWPQDRSAAVFDQWFAQIGLVTGCYYNPQLRKAAASLMVAAFNHSLWAAIQSINS